MWEMVMKIKIKFLILFHGSTFAPLLFVCILNWLLISIYFRINKVISGKGNSTYYAYSSNSLDIFILQRNSHLKSKILSKIYIGIKHFYSGKNTYLFHWYFMFEVIFYHNQYQYLLSWAFTIQQEIVCKRPEWWTF